jgi:hypothetical protein
MPAARRSVHGQAVAPDPNILTQARDMCELHVLPRLAFIPSGMTAHKVWWCDFLARTVVGAGPLWVRLDRPSDVRVKAALTLAAELMRLLGRQTLTSGRTDYAAKRPRWASSHTSISLYEAPLGSPAGPRRWLNWNLAERGGKAGYL